MEPLKLATSRQAFQARSSHRIHCTISIFTWKAKNFYKGRDTAVLPVSLQNNCFKRWSTKSVHEKKPTLSMCCRILPSSLPHQKTKGKKIKIIIIKSCKGCRLVPGNISGLSAISKFRALNTSKDGAYWDTCVWEWDKSFFHTVYADCHEQSAKAS